ncbi:MAG TPA: sigma-70 family RNA polymerase sigma factor [Kofleriaceae bacterium]
MTRSAIAEMFEAGRAAWPDVAIDRDAFARFVEERAGEHDVRELHAGDLYLACACAAAEPAALAAFERAYLGQVDAFLRGVRATPELADEVRQVLRERLFLAEHRRIVDYSGRGTLASWLRVAALRAASNLRRTADARDRIEARAPASPVVPLDPELALVRSRHAGDFERALHDAFDSLDERERNLLRLHFLDGLGIDGLAPVFGVHRATVARWLAAARERLQGAVLALLRERLAVGERELESLARLVRSDLEISLPSLFRAQRD